MGQTMLYHPDRAIDLAATIPGLIPMRLFAMLYPLWLVEIDGEQEIKRPYALIEEYIERGIQEAELHTVEEMVSFFGLSTPLVKKVLQFLATIQHIQEAKGRWALTERGLQSLREGQKSVARQEKGQYLYFDGFCCKPLLQEHYKRLQVKDDLEAESVARKESGGHQFYRLHSGVSWNAKALDDLLQSSDAAQYNVPPGLSGVKPTGISRVYMPMYIVEMRKTRFTQKYYLVCTHRKDYRDGFFEQIINGIVTIQQTLEAMPGETNLAGLWTAWLSKNNLSHLHPERTPDGLWRVVFPEDHFRTSAYPLRKIGTYYKERGYFLQIWCNNDVLRRRAVADYMLNIVLRGYRTLSSEWVQRQLQQRAELLQVAAVSLHDLSSWARECKAQEDVLQKLEEWLEEKRA